MDLQGRRNADRKLSEARREARRDYERYAEQEADAERDYRKGMSVEFAKCKTDGKTNQQSEIDAKAATADLRHKRDIAHSLAFSARMRIAELERDGVWSETYTRPRRGSTTLPRDRSHLRSVGSAAHEVHVGSRDDGRRLQLRQRLLHDRGGAPV